MIASISKGSDAQLSCWNPPSSNRNIPRPVFTTTRKPLSKTRAFFPSVLADVAPQVSSTASEVANQANQAVPGSVSAPAWVIPVAALVVTVGGAASAFLLKPGADAAEKVFERDAKRLGNQARYKASQAGSKAKQVTKKGRR